MDKTDQSKKFEENWLSARSRHVDVVVTLRNAALLLFYYFFFRKIAIFWPNAAWIWSFFTFFLPFTDWVDLFIYNSLQAQGILGDTFRWIRRVHFPMKNHPKWRYFLDHNVEVSGKQNSLFPLGPVIKCLLSQGSLEPRFNFTKSCRHKINKNGRTVGGTERRSNIQCPTYTEKVTFSE